MGCVAATAQERVLVLCFFFAFLTSVLGQAITRGPLIPGLQRVPDAVLPPRNIAASGVQPQLTTPQQQPGCPVPAITREDFSASQVAYLVAELQQSITPGCYSVVSTSLAVCLPDFSLSSGCCTPACARSLRLAVSPECLGQLWSYVCSNGTYFAPYVSGVVNRCLPASALNLNLSCPVNGTLMNQLLSLGSMPGGLASVYDNSTAADPGSGSAVLMPAGTDQRDAVYYAGCTQEPPRLWPDFNGSLLFDSLLAFARDVPQDCLRTSLAYLPSCYDDLTYQSGCCSLRCRAAVEKVPVQCFISFQRSLCTRIPTLTKYFFNAGRRCANLTLSCQGFDSEVAPMDSFGVPSSRSLPLVASTQGQCPLSEVTWPGYQAVTVISGTLRLLADASAACRQHIAKTSSACQPEMAIKLGCCSYDCALAMRSVPENCNVEFRRLLCQQPDVAKYTVALAGRCLGTGYYECAPIPPDQPAVLQAASGNTSSTGTG